MMLHNSYQHNRLIIGLRAGVLLLFAAVFLVVHGPALVSRAVIAMHQWVVPQRTAAMPDEVTALQAKVKDLETENARINEIITRVGDSKKQFVFGHIVFGGGFLFTDTLSIDRGRESGIVSGDFVATKESILVGTIIQTGERWSTVAPFTQLGRKVLVRAGEKKDIVFEAMGVGGEEIEVDLPATVNLKAGDVVWSAEKPDYIVGLVDRLDSSSARQIQNVFIKPPIAFKALTDVEIYHK